MSIIRLSTIGAAIYATDAVGNIVDEPFSLRRGEHGEGAMPAYRRGKRPRGTRDPLRKFLRRALKAKAAKLTDDKPVVVMVHGFQFDPGMAVFTPPHHQKADNPHARLYHFERHEEAREMRSHSSSWPLGLGFAEHDEGAAGLCVGFGWYSNPGFFSSLFDSGKNFYAKAYDNAEGAAWQLLCVLDVLAQELDRPIDLFCHSLGSRVVVRALAMAASPLPDLAAHIDPDHVVRPVLDRTDRVLLLAGAEKVLEAQLMMAYLNRWRKEADAHIPDFYNVISRENDVLDKLGENFGPAAPGSKQVIGHNGLERLDPAWVDIQLDDDDVAAWFLKPPRKYRVSGDNNSSVFAVMDHWIHYTWRENMRVYHDILRDRGAWTVAGMKGAPDDLFNRPRLNRGPRHA